jgi:soluble lytic murein transglycosylase-like protein
MAPPPRGVRYGGAMLLRNASATLGLLLLAATALLGLSCKSRRGPAPEQARARLVREETLDIAWLPAPVSYWKDELERLGAVHGVAPDLLAIIVLVESGGNPQARSTTGAVGLMQIVPGTGRHIAAERQSTGHTDEKLYQPRYNLDFGAWYLTRQLQSFAVDDEARSVDLAAAAYNGGPTRLARHLQGDATLSGQTERYVRWVGGMWRERREPSSATYQAWLDAGGSRLVARAAHTLGLDESS